MLFRCPVSARGSLYKIHAEVTAAVNYNLPHEYNAEYHFGFVPYDYSVSTARQNTALYNEILNQSWVGGGYRFRRGTVTRGPVERPVRFPPKVFYFTPTIELPTRLGGAMLGHPGGASYLLGDDQFAPTAAGFTGGLRTRFVCINGETGPLIRYRGASYEIGNIDFFGRRAPDENTFIGIRSLAAIQMEGRAGPPPTGRGHIHDCSFNEFTYGIQTIPGYYDELGLFVDDVNHADLTSVHRCEVTRCNTFFRSENAQSSDWHFDTISPNVLIGGEMTLFDYQRGGSLSAFNIQGNHHKLTILNVHGDGYTHHTQRFNIQDIKWDNFPSDDGSSFITYFKYEGPTAQPFMKYTCRFTGSIPHSDTDPSTYDSSKLIIPNGVPTDDILFDVSRLPIAGFTAPNPPNPWRMYDP